MPKIIESSVRRCKDVKSQNLMFLILIFSHHQSPSDGGLKMSWATRSDEWASEKVTRVNLSCSTRLKAVILLAASIKHSDGLRTESSNLFSHSQHSTKASFSYFTLVRLQVVLSHLFNSYFYQMSIETTTTVILSIIQVGIGLAALHYQRQAQPRRRQRTAPIPCGLTRLTLS